MTSAIGSRYSIEFLNAQLKRMASNWRIPMSEEEAENTRANYAEVLMEVGEQRFGVAVSQAIKHHPHYFPTVAEFRPYIPDRPAIDPSQKFCPKCSRTEGMLMEERPHPWKDGQTHMVASRCKHA